MVYARRNNVALVGSTLQGKKVRLQGIAVGMNQWKDSMLSRIGGARGSANCPPGLGGRDRTIRRGQGA